MKNKAQVMEMVLKGYPVIVLTYHGAKAEAVNYRDKTTRATATFKSLRHTCLSESGAVIWQERVGDDFDTAKYVSPYKQGDKIAVTITSLQTTGGVTTVSGTGEVAGLQ